MTAFKPGDVVMIGRISTINGVLWTVNHPGCLAIIEKHVFTNANRGPLYIVRVLDSYSELGSYYESELTLHELSPLEKVIYGL